MKIWFKEILKHPFAKKGYDWIKLLGITGGTQVIIQAIGFVSGILVIRVLSTDQYALFTLANTMLGTMIILSDAGISSGVMAEGAKVWEDKKKLGEVVETGFVLRKKFALVSLLVSIPILLYLLLANDASWLVAITIVVALIPGFIASLSANLLETPAKLKQDIIPLQKNQLQVNIIRLLILAPTVFLLPWAAIAILPSGVSQVWGNFKLRKIISSYVELKQNVSEAVRKKILAITVRTLPGAIYFCVSGQLTVWILAIYGTTNNVAEIGALGRIAVLLSLITVLFKTLIVPRFARLLNDFKLLFKRFVTIQMLLVLVVASVVGLVYLFSTQILWVLGPKYYGLEKEIVLVILGGSLNLYSALSTAICYSKGWVINPLITIPISIATMITCVLFFDVSTLQGVLIFNIIIALVNAIMNSLYGFYKILSLKKA